MKLSPRALAALRCPVCRAELVDHGGQLQCADGGCASEFPVVDGIPVLINEARSVFAIQDFVGKRSTFFAPRTRIQRSLSRIFPTISLNLAAKNNYARYARLLLAHSKHPLVLVLGGSVSGRGMEGLLSNSDLELVETDVSFGPRTAVVCDAHDIPFDGGTFDGVIAQAVLEHVVDPYRSVEEIYRVLKKHGLVYAETPFMQQVHGGRYDFTRFTYLGYRRLFRRFEGLDTGIACGPGMALAWSYVYFLMSFTRSRLMRSALRAFGRLTGFWLKYFDWFLVTRPGALDAASAYYFLGRKKDVVLSDKELMESYPGMCT